jgi:pyruvate dehydrogenase E1 component alpha subunit
MTTAATVNERAAKALGGDRLIELYRAMTLARRVDQRALSLHEDGAIGFHVSSLGEEAAIVGAAFAMRERDWLFPCYREFGAAFVRGMPLARYFDNLYGNANDVAKGRQMPNYWSYKKARIASASAPNGSQLTAGVGVAWAAKMKRETTCVLIFLDDEATSSGDFHNAMNFAGVYRVPAVLLCKNDGWARADRVRQTASEGLAEKGIAYGVDAVTCDGNDVLAVIATVQDAIERASTGEGSTLIEARTQRIAAAELEQSAKHDPVVALRGHLSGWDDAREGALLSEIDAEIDAAVSAAEAAEPPPIDSMFDDVFDELPWHLREQRDELRSQIADATPERGGKS